MMRFRGRADKAGYFKPTNNTNNTTMTKKKVSLSSIDAFVEQDIIVEVPEEAGEELATEKAMAGEGEVIRERVYGVEAEAVNADVSDAASSKAMFQIMASSKATFEVMGVFLDTASLQPFTREVGAAGPEEALAWALAEVESINEEAAQEKYVNELLGSNLAVAASNAEVRPVSIRRTSVVTDRTEYLHEIDSFS
jgi:ribosomal protein L20A (L18A)